MSIDFGTIPNLDDMVEICFEIGKCTPLMFTILDRNENSPHEVRRVLDNHKDFTFLNRPDPMTNSTPLLQLACMETTMPQAPEIVKILLEPKYGVDIHARSGPMKCQAIFAAAELGSTAIVKLLIDHGGDLLSSTPDQRPPTTPINIAIQHNHVEVVALLVNAAKKTGLLDKLLNHTRNGINQTAVQVAMSRQRTEIIGIIARAAGDLRNSFDAVWDKDPYNTEKCVWADPDPKMYPETWALYKTVYSFVSKSCCNCREPVSDEAKTCCSSCTMAWYCGSDCQKKDWKTHKKCCKRLKRGVDLVLGSGKRKLVPYPLVEQTGFEEEYIESKNQLGSIRDFPYNYAWEYHGIDDKDPAKRVWKKYPPLINYSIESHRELDDHQYLYRPNDHDSEGNFHYAPYTTQDPPAPATRYVYFDCMMEFDVYTGAVRAVRRTGEDSPEPQHLREWSERLSKLQLFEEE